MKSFTSFKKTLIIILFMFVAMFTCSLDVFAANPSNVTTADEVSYYVGETKDDYDLGYGVQYSRDIAYSKINKKGVVTGAISGSGKGGEMEVDKYYSQQVNILSLKPNEDVQIVPYALLTGSEWKLSKIVNSALDYEKNHPGYKVIGGINADFFKTTPPYGSNGVTVSNGEYYASNVGNSPLAIKNDGSVNSIFTLKDHTMAYTITFYDEQGEEIFKTTMAGFNTEPNENEVTLYFLQRESNANLSRWSTQTVSNAWIVKNAQKAVTVRYNNFYGKGEITEFVSGEFTFTHDKPEFGIKSNNAEVNKYLKAGATVRVQREFTSTEAEGIHNFIGTQEQFLVDGTFVDGEGHVTQPTTRCPRTIIGIKADGTILMIVIDGRHYELGFHGMGSAELSALCKHYGLINAWNLDGGGSSTLIVRKQDTFRPSAVYNDKDGNNWWVTNNPSDGSERSDANCLLIVAKVPEVKSELSAKTGTSLSLTITNIEELGKYKELYIYYNDEFEKVVDGKVEIKGLKSSTIYVFPVYAKIDGKYFSLFSNVSGITAYQLYEIKNFIYDVEFNSDLEVSYELSVSFQNIECVKDVYLVIGDNKMKFKKNKLELTDEVLNLLIFEDYKIVIEYDLDDLTGIHENEYQNINFNVKSSVIMFDAINQKANNVIDELIK